MIQREQESKVAELSFLAKTCTAAKRKRRLVADIEPNPTAQPPIHRLKKRVATYNLLSWLFELTPLRWRTLTANIVAWPCHLLVQMVLSGLPQLSQNVARKVILKNSPWTNSMINEAPNSPAIELEISPQPDQKTAKWPGSCFFSTDGDFAFSAASMESKKKMNSTSTQTRLIKQHFLMRPLCDRTQILHVQRVKKQSTECKGVNWKGWLTSCQASMLWPWLVPTKWEHPIMCTSCESTSGRCQEFR